MVMLYGDPQDLEQLKWAAWDKRSNQIEAGMTRLKETCTYLGTFQVVMNAAGLFLAPLSTLVCCSFHVGLHNCVACLIAQCL